jgi:hypothetical protein
MKSPFKIVLEYLEYLDNTIAEIKEFERERVEQIGFIEPLLYGDQKR